MNLQNLGLIGVYRFRVLDFGMRTYKIGAYRGLQGLGF